MKIFLSMMIVICLMMIGCVKAPVVKTYADAMALPDIVVAIPRGEDARPIWDQALLTSTFETWCRTKTRVRLLDGNDWKNSNGFVCLENPRKNQIVFQELKRKGWQFRWSCTLNESACVLKR